MPDKYPPPYRDPPDYGSVSSLPEYPPAQNVRADQHHGNENASSSGAHDPLDARETTTASDKGPNPLETYIVGPKLAAFLSWVIGFVPLCFAAMNLHEEFKQPIRAALVFNLVCACITSAFPFGWTLHPRSRTDRRPPTWVLLWLATRLMLWTAAVVFIWTVIAVRNAWFWDNLLVSATTGLITWLLCLIQAGLALKIAERQFAPSDIEDMYRKHALHAEATNE